MKPQSFCIIVASIAILLVFSVIFSSCKKDEFMAIGTIVVYQPTGYISMCVEVDKEYPIGTELMYGMYRNIIQTQPLSLSDTTIKINQKIAFNYRKYNNEKDYYLFIPVVTHGIAVNIPKYVITNYQILNLK